MIEFLLKLSVIWVSASIIVISTVWYLAVTIPQRWPDWWYLAGVAVVSVILLMFVTLFYRRYEFQIARLVQE